tara:strand:- start:428 stop:742 length:315 start_codon:yes stop_codon:yes gene_type:complete
MRDREADRRRLMEANLKTDKYQASIRGMSLQEYLHDRNTKQAEVTMERLQIGMERSIRDENYEQSALIRDYMNTISPADPCGDFGISIKIKDIYRYPSDYYHKN